LKHFQVEPAEDIAASRPAWARELKLREISVVAIGADVAPRVGA